MMKLNARSIFISATAALMSLHVHAIAAPVETLWSSDAAQAVDAAALSGWYASSDTSSDSISIRDVRQTLIRTINRADLLAHAPWMSLDASDDGPRALAWTDSGRSLFIVVTDDSSSPDGLGSDVVLRYDTTTDELTRFTRAHIGDASGIGPAAMHYAAELWVSTSSGSVRVYDAARNDTQGVLKYTWSLPSADPIHGLCIAREHDLAFAISENALFSIDMTQSFASAVELGPLSDARAVAYSDHLAGFARDGVYVLEANGAASRIMQVPILQALGVLAYSPFVYAASVDGFSDLAATPCGGLLVASTNGAEMIRDSDDTRLDYESWLQDEFDQIVTFGSGLVAPDGEPAGWVIDGDVAAGGNRFHPPSPDGAAWVVMLHIAKDHLDGTDASKSIVRDILMRYAGQMPDGIAPSVTSDGILHHWYDPQTGNSAPGWSSEYATLSTMLLVMSADRARRFYGDDPQIVAASDEIIERIQNWDSYIQPGSRALYLRAEQSGGPDFGTAGGPFYEGVLFVEQAAAYGNSEDDFSFWLDRSQLPSSEYVSGQSVTTNSSGSHLPAFVTLYPWIAQAPMRADPDWESHTRNLLASFGAWTDDHAPSSMTVFSAGTTKPEWGGYNADSISNHPGDITTFPSLMGFGSLGETAPSVGAYHAYRHGLRQNFETGASILYRRSNVDSAYTPGDAGLPDVVIGALGLAELIRPGTIDAVLAIPYQNSCPADYALPKDTLDVFDVFAYLDLFNAQDQGADLARPFGEFDIFDVFAFLSAFNAGCP